MVLRTFLLWILLLAVQSATSLVCHKCKVISRYPFPACEGPVVRSARVECGEGEACSVRRTSETVGHYLSQTIERGCLQSNTTVTGCYGKPHRRICVSLCNTDLCNTGNGTQFKRHSSGIILFNVCCAVALLFGTTLQGR